MKIFEVLSTLFSIELENHLASKKVSLFFVIASLMTPRERHSKEQVRVCIHFASQTTYNNGEMIFRDAK